MRWRFLVNCIQSISVIGRCGIGYVPLLFQHKPGTPLRVLCIFALDYVRQQHSDGSLSKEQISALSDLLFQGAEFNARIDHKSIPQPSASNTPGPSQSQLINDYVTKIKALECDRPFPGCSSAVVHEYRERVLVTSLGAAAAVAFRLDGVNEGVAMLDREPRLQALTAIVVMCQIVDDAIDYESDLALGLASYLTCESSLEAAIKAAQDRVKQLPLPSCDPAIFTAGVFMMGVTQLGLAASRVRARFDGGGQLASRLRNEMHR